MATAVQGDAARVLRARVAAVLATPSPTPLLDRMPVKTTIVLVWLFGSGLVLALGHWPTPVVAGLAVSLGAASACGMLAIGHAGTHRTTFGRGPASAVTSRTAAAVSGVTAAWWRAKHNIAHHGGVPDGGRAGEGPLVLGPVARLAADQPRRPWHAAQPVYFYALYATQHAGMVAQNLTFALTGRVAGHRAARRTVGHVVGQLGQQLAVPGTLVGIAALEGHGAGGILVVVAVASAVSGVAMSLVLAVEVAHRGTAVIPDGSGAAAWTQWQGDVAMTIVTPSRAARWFAGELNFHTEHHLFPRAPMDRLADLQPVVRDTLREQGLPYHEYPTFRASWRAFHRHLVAMAAPVDGDPQVRPAAR